MITLLTLIVALCISDSSLSELNGLPPSSLCWLAEGFLVLFALQKYSSYLVPVACVLFGRTYLDSQACPEVIDADLLMRESRWPFYFFIFSWKEFWMVPSMVNSNPSHALIRVNLNPKSHGAVSCSISSAPPTCNVCGHDVGWMNALTN